jgi:8-oxo-dGTP pyrophosphatase MutT (NUDIX family)
MPDPFGHGLPDVLEAALQGRPPGLRPEWPARPAAVLVPLLEEDGVWKLLFTLRTETLDDHRGQVSFPGGRLEDGETDPLQTALRETQEEIGIPAGDVEVLGRLDSLLTVTQFLIHPIVGRIPWPTALQLNPREVAAAFAVPLQWLARPENLEIRHRQPLAGQTTIPVYYFRPFDEHVIWGATAHIVINLLDRLGSTPLPSQDG